jgi:hypothetical protein
MCDDLVLEHSWNIFFHDYMDSDWSRESYEILGTTSTIIQFWTMFNIIKQKINTGMFFFMKNGVFPKWDDNHEKKFSFLTIKVLKEKVPDFCEYILVRLLSGNIIRDKNINQNVVDGISVSPKKNFCIFKVWICSPDPLYKDTTLYDIPTSYHGDVFIKEYSI